MEAGNKVVIADKQSGTDVDLPGVAEALFAKEKPDAVFHLAGPINLRKSPADALFVKDLDFLSRTARLLDACKKYHVKKIVFVSSGGAVYEEAAVIPTPEDYLVHPQSLYGLANLMVEKHLQLYGGNHGLPVTIVRLSNVYGPRQWESGFIPAMIIKMLQKEVPIMHGTGRQTRDFIYIDDVVEALTVLAGRGGSEIYNIGSGRETSLNDIFDMIKNILGLEITAIHGQPRAFAFEVPRSAVAIKKMKKTFGWAPTTSLKAGLKKTIAYYKNAKPE